MPPKTALAPSLRALDSLPPSPASSPGGRGASVEESWLSLTFLSSSEGADADDGSESDFVPDEKTASPDSDEEFPRPFRSLPLAAMDVDDEDSTPPPQASSIRVVLVSWESVAHQVVEVCTSRAIASSNSVVTSSVARQGRRPRPRGAPSSGLGDSRPRSLTSLSIATPRTLARRGTALRACVGHRNHGDVQGPPPREKSSRDSPPKSSTTLRIISRHREWLQKLADGDHSVARFPAALPPAELPPPTQTTPTRVYRAQARAQTIRSHCRCSRRPGTVFDVRGVPDAVREEREASGSTMRKKWRVSDSSKRTTSPPSRPGNPWANDYHRRSLPIVRARQVEVLASYQADRERIIDRIKRQANTIGEYAYFLAKRALSRSGSGRGVSSRIAAASGEPVPRIALPSNEASGKLTTSSCHRSPRFRRATRTPARTAVGGFAHGRPQQGKGESDRLDVGSRGSAGSVSNTSRSRPARPFCQPEPPSAGSFLGTGSPGGGPDAAKGARRPLERDRRQLSRGALTTVPARRGPQREWDEGRRLPRLGTRPVNPRFPRASRSLRGACFADALLGSNFLRKDHVISTMNAELVNMYVDAILSSLTPLTGVDVAARIMSRVIVYCQDAKLREGRAPRTDPSEAGAPWSVAWTFSFARSRTRAVPRAILRPFQGAQFGNREHRLPLPVVQDPSDAATFLTHVLEDIVERISAGLGTWGARSGSASRRPSFPTAESNSRWLRGRRPPARPGWVLTYTSQPQPYS
ncbi:hypothetical protein B0H14DRAFT_2613403 [Mycena olivaceomarginata]|nr:hypothetical protein B0H14DRAFT_2613403 [Mycena olivaceomarginata]